MADNWWESWPRPLAPYAVLLQLLVDSRMSVGEFEVAFLRMYKMDDERWPEEVFTVLDALFADIDRYTPHEEVRLAIEGLDEEAIRARAHEAFTALQLLTGS